MDVLRSCYKRRIRFVKDDPTKTAVATWYFAAKTAKVFPGLQLFSSAVWDSFHPTAVTLGDDESFSRQYYNGRRLNASDGTKFAGPLRFFTEGADAPSVLPRGADGFTPRECMVPPFGINKGGMCLPVGAGIGGLVLGGNCVPSSITTPCFSGSPFSFTATAHADEVACACLDLIAFPMVWDGLKYTGSFVACGSTMRLDVQCFGIDWIYSLWIDGIIVESDLSSLNFAPTSGSDFFVTGPGACSMWHVTYS